MIAHSVVLYEKEIMENIFKPKLVIRVTNMDSPIITLYYVGLSIPALIILFILHPTGAITLIALIILIIIAILAFPYINPYDQRFIFAPDQGTEEPKILKNNLKKRDSRTHCNTLYALNDAIGIKLAKMEHQHKKRENRNYPYKKILMSREFILIRNVTIQAYAKSAYLSPFPTDESGSCYWDPWVSHCCLD